MRLASGGYIHVAVPRLQNRKGKVSRRTEAKQSYTIPVFHTGDAQASEPDDSRTKERRSMEIVQFLRQRKHEVPPRQRIFGIPSVYRVSRKRRRVAKVLETSKA